MSTSPTKQEAPASSVSPQQMVKAGEHPLTAGELVLFSEIYQSFEKIQTLIAMLMCEKHGYPEKEPIAFQLDFANKKAIAFRPSQIEVANNEPSTPATDKAA